MGLYTVKADGSAELIVEKSRFICHVKRVQSKEQAYEYIKQLKKTNWDARITARLLLSENRECSKAQVMMVSLVAPPGYLC